MNVSERMIDLFGHEEHCHTNGCPGMGWCARITVEAQQRVANGGALRFFNEEKCGDTGCTCITTAITVVVSMEVRTLIAKVLAFHRPSDDHGPYYSAYCVGCWEEGGEDGAPTWPCKTAQMVQDWS